MFFCFSLRCNQGKTPSLGETLYCSFVTLPSVAIADSEKGKKKEEEEEEEEEEEDEEEDQEEPEHRRTKKKIGYAFFF